MNFTSTHNLQLIKNNIINVYAEHLRYTVQDKTEEQKICALGVFVGKISCIKNLQKLTNIRRRYEET